MIRQKEPTILTLECAGRRIASKPSLKVLGVVIDHRLRWSVHIKQLVSRVRGLIGGLKMVRRKFTEAQTKILVTSQLLSILHYACPAWKVQEIGINSFLVSATDCEQQKAKDP